MKLLQITNLEMRDHALLQRLTDEPKTTAKEKKCPPCPACGSQDTARLKRKRDRYAYVCRECGKDWRVSTIFLDSAKS